MLVEPAAGPPRCARVRLHRLFVRPSRFGGHKTLAAGQQVPHFALMTAAETPISSPG